MAKKELKNKGGRPSIFTKKLADTICARIASGESLRAICREEKMPHISTVMDWVLDSTKKGFSEQYESACNARAELMFEELLEIADDGQNDWMEKENKDGSTYVTLNGEYFGRSRLRIDTRKWFLSKIMPKKFGDKVDHTSGGKPIPIISLDVLRNNGNQEGSETE